MPAQNIEFIVLSFTKFGESSVVLHTLSKEYGRCGFLVRSAKRAGLSLFLPMNILEAQITDNPKGSLRTAKNISAKFPLNGIRNNIYKNSITMFLSEVLFRTIKDGENEDGLFDWCQRQILTLDTLEKDFSNFHIWFLLELAVALGFSPSEKDLVPFIGEQDFLTSSFESVMLTRLTGEKRNAICEGIIRYLEFHVESSINIRSLAVLRELFA